MAYQGVNEENIPVFRGSMTVLTTDFLLRLAALEFYRIVYDHSTELDDILVFFGIHVLITVFSIFYTLYRQYHFCRSLEDAYEKDGILTSFKAIFKGYKRPEFELKHANINVIIQILYIVIFCYTVLYIRYDTIVFLKGDGSKLAMYGGVPLFFYSAIVLMIAMNATPSPILIPDPELRDALKSAEEEQEGGYRLEDGNKLKLISRWVKDDDNDELKVKITDFQLPLTEETKNLLAFLHRKTVYKDEADAMKIILLLDENYPPTAVSAYLHIFEHLVDEWKAFLNSPKEVREKVLVDVPLEKEG